MVKNYLYNLQCSECTTVKVEIFAGSKFHYFSKVAPFTRIKFY